MVECGRLALFSAAAFCFCARALLASPPSPEQATCQGFHPSSRFETNWTAQTEAAQPHSSSTCRTSRVAYPEVVGYDDELLGMSMHQQGLRQPTQSTMVWQLRPALYDCEMVGSQGQSRPVCEQKETKREEGEGIEIRHVPKQRPSCALWSKGDGGCEGRSSGSGWAPMGEYHTDEDSADADAYDCSDPESAGHRKGEGQTTRGRSGSPPEVSSSSREVVGERDRRRRTVDKSSGGRIGCEWTSPDAEARPQGCDAAPEGGEGQGELEDTTERVGCQMDKLARVHEEQAQRTEGVVYGQQESPPGTLWRDTDQDRRAQRGDQECHYAANGRTRRRRSVLLGILGSRCICGGQDRPYGHERRRGTTQNQDRKAKSGSRLKVHIPLSFQIKIKGFKRPVVAFGEEVDVVVYDDEGSNECFFRTTHYGLECWSAKPWSLHPGVFADQALRNYYHHGFLGRLRVGELGLLRQHFLPAELYGILGRGHREGNDRRGDLLHEHSLCDAVPQGDVLWRDLLHGQTLTVRTWGVRNRCIGEKTILINEAINLRTVVEAIRRVWHEGPDAWLRMHLVPNLNPNEIDDVRVVVEFEGWNTTMMNVPVLFTYYYTIGGDQYMEEMAGYTDHVVDYATLINCSGMADLNTAAHNNKRCIWLNNEIVIPELPFLVLPGDNISIAYHADDEMYAGSNDEGERNTRKRARSEEEVDTAPAQPGEEPDDEADDELREDGDSDPNPDEEDEDNDYNHRVRAHLYHFRTDYVFDRLDAQDPFTRRQQAAQAWNVPVTEIIGLHPVRAPPADLVGRDVIITRWTSDSDHREWPDDVQVLLDIIVDDPSGAQMKRRTVRWSRPANTRLGILRWIRAEGYCGREAQSPCRVWYNNAEWAKDDLRIQRVAMGDYIRVTLPTQAGRTLLESDRQLRQLERICRCEHFFDSPTSEEEDTSDQENEESESGDSRRTMPEPEPHDELRTPVSIAEHLQHADLYKPMKEEDAGFDKAQKTGGLCFAEVWDLLQWLDYAVVIPAWTLPQGCQWHEATTPWLDNEWWSYQVPLEVCFYTDGSCTPQGAGAAVVLFVKSLHGWHYGGYIAQTCIKRCAHFAELQALVMSFHWLHGLLTYCALMNIAPPTVTFCFDATSAGYKAFGYWGGSGYPAETENIRSIWRMLTSKFQFEWTTHHVAAHQGEGGNEAANTAAQAAANSTTTLRSSSTWGHYVMLTRDKALHWLWALWKKEWKEYWQGKTLFLPTCPATKPSAGVLGFCEQPPELVEAGSESTEIACTLVSANVLTLMPGRKQLQEKGLLGKTRTEILQRQFHEVGAHVVGLQETRMRKPTKIETEDYIVLCGCANARGHYGTQLWFSRKLPLDKAGTLYFKKEHMKILHQDPRRLCVRVRSPFMKAIVISAHAPHSQAAEAERQDWWQQLAKTIPARYKDWHHVVMIDANARLGEYPNGLVGDFAADTQDDNGGLFCDFLTCNGYWLPSTFEATHSGESGTWWHQQSEKWVRGDFICLSASLPLTSCRSPVLHEIDLSLQKDDHRPVCVHLSWTTVCDTINHSAAGRQQKFDSHVVQEALNGPFGGIHLKDLAHCLPECEWTVDVHTHMAQLQRCLQGWTSRLCRHQIKKPLKKTLSATTWTWVCEKRALRQQHFEDMQHHRKERLRCLFLRWRGVQCQWPYEEKEASHRAALNLRKFMALGKEVTKAIRSDDREYFEELCRSMGDPMDRHVGFETWKKIKWAMPKTQQKRKQSPFLLEELDDQWLPHLAELEAGEVVTPQQLVDRCCQRQQNRCHLRAVRLEDIPTLGEVESTLRAVQPHRAPGPDRLPGSLFRYGATALAIEVHSLYAKSIAWEAEAVQNKGGVMMPVHKAGPTTMASQYRGIMMLNILAKGLHAIMRRRIMSHLTPVRLSSQLGGFSFQQAQFGAQCVQTLARICAGRRLSHCTLFVDIKGAYHYLIRELVMGVESPQDLEAVIAHLEHQQIDNKGVKLWSQLPGVLERIRADPKLISTLRELHCDTWAALPNTPSLMRSRRGSRPGSPIADSIYHALMMDIHIEIHRLMEEDEGAVDGFQAAEVPICAVTWADDLAVPVISRTAIGLVPLVQRLTKKILFTF